MSDRRRRPPASGNRSSGRRRPNVQGPRRTRRITPLQRLRKVVRAVALSVAAAGLTAVVVFIGSYLLFPVGGLEVLGNRALSESEVGEAVPDRSSLPLISSRNLERRLKVNPLVKDVNVTKDWESGIVTVEVEERRAVLDGEVGGEEIVVSGDGTRLPEAGDAALEEIQLDEGRLDEVLKGIRALDEGGVDLKSVDRVDAGGVYATARGPGGQERRVVFAGDVGEGQAQVLKGVMERRPEAPYFDLRSPRRVVVGEQSPAGT